MPTTAAFTPFSAASAAGLPRRASQKGSDADHQEKGGEEDGKETEEGAGQSVGLRPHDGAEIGREGEERARHGLRGAIASKKHIVAHPTWRHDLGLEERQDDMAPAEDERARAIEGIHEPHGLASGHAGQKRQPDQQDKEENKRDERDGAPDNKG